MAYWPNLVLIDHPLVQHKMTLLRRKETSTAEFRRLAREVSMLMAYELTRSLPLETVTIATPLEETELVTHLADLRGVRPASVQSVEDLVESSQRDHDRVLPQTRITPETNSER